MNTSSTFEASPSLSSKRYLNKVISDFEKTAKVAQSINYDFYTISEDSLIGHDYINGTSKKVFEINHAYLPRVAYTNEGRIFLIGGALTKENRVLSNETKELVLSLGRTPVL